MPRSMAPELDECSLQNIFDKVGDARQAKCSMVCRRWRQVCYSATRLTFSLSSKNSKEEMWAHEETIAAILWRVKRKAAGCLKELEVQLRDDNYNAEASAHWLALADSLTTLTLSGAFLARMVWSYAVNSPTLERLSIDSDCYDFFDAGFPQGGCSSRLKTCHLSSPVSVKLLEGLVAACPVLEELRAIHFEVEKDKGVKFQMLTLSSPSLRTLHIRGNFKARRFQLLLQDTPSLTRLYFGGRRLKGGTTSIRTVHSLDKLTRLSLEGFSTLDQVFDKVEKLTLVREMDGPEQVEEVLEHTPAITTLRLESFFGCCISPLLSRLPRLKHVRASDGVALKSLDSDVKMERLTVHVRVHIFHSAPEMPQVLKKLLACCSIQRLVVKLEAEFDKNPGNETFLNDLSELLLLYPDRVSLKSRAFSESNE